MININKSIPLYFIFLLLSPVFSYFTLSTFNISSQYYNGVLISVIGFFFIFSSKKKIMVPSYAWILLAYFFYTLIWSFITGEASERGYRIISKNQLLHSFFAIIVINNYNFSDLFIKKAIRLMKLTLIVAAIVSLIQVFNFSFMDANPIWSRGTGGDTLIGDIYQDRRSSIFGFIDPNELGLSFLPLLSVLIGVLLYQRKRYYLFFLLLGGISALLSNTRYVMVGFIIITFQIIIVQRKKLLGSIKFLLIAFFSAFIFFQILAYIGYDTNKWAENRLFSERSFEETTRYKAIGNFLLFFPQKPLFGFGQMTYEIKQASIAVGSSQIHVGYLAHLVYFGIFGSLLFFSFLFTLGKRLYLNSKSTGFWGSFLGFMVFVWANATLVTFHIFFYGILIALVVDKMYTNKNQLNLK